jgi:hypothetical protein
VAVTAGQFVSAADISAGKLLFTPAANANGAGYASFTFQVQDDGGTTNGGVDGDPTPRTMTVNVTNVNDAPQGTSHTVTTLEDTPYTFATSDFGKTWREVTLPPWKASPTQPAPPKISQLFFLDPSHGWIVQLNCGKDQDGVLRTVDGGSTWSTTGIGSSPCPLGAGKFVDFVQEFDGIHSVDHFKKR